MIYFLLFVDGCSNNQPIFCYVIISNKKEKKKKIQWELHASATSNKNKRSNWYRSNRLSCSYPPRRARATAQGENIGLSI